MRRRYRFRGEKRVFQCVVGDFYGFEHGEGGVDLFGELFCRYEDNFVVSRNFHLFASVDVNTLPRFNGYYLECSERFNTHILTCLHRIDQGVEEFAKEIFALLFLFSCLVSQQTDKSRECYLFVHQRIFCLRSDDGLKFIVNLGGISIFLPDDG